MRQVADKWIKHKVLKQHQGVSKHIPATCRFSHRALRLWLQQYPFVVAKPLKGTGGSGVIKIEKTGSTYRIHHATDRKQHLTWTELTAAIARIRKARAYMLQQGIVLAPVRNRKTDYRVKLVKEEGRWKVTAVVARLAGRGQFVTNLCSGGQLMKGREALRRAFPRQAMPKKNTMVGVARTCTYLLEKRYPGIGQLGFDFGIDRKGNIWLFEVNTRPH